MSRYRSSRCSRCSRSSDVELRLFFTAAEVDEPRREQGGAPARLSHRSPFRFMEAAAARQEATTMAPAHPPRPPPAPPRALPAATAGGREPAAQEPRTRGPVLGARPARSAAAALTTAPPTAASRRRGRPQPAKRVAEAAVPPPAGAVRVSARPLPPWTPPWRSRSAEARTTPGNPRTAVLCSFIHKKNKRPTTLLGATDEASHWSSGSDVTETGPCYRQVVRDAIKNSLSGSTNQR
jgi:hypothetical protein